MLRNSLNKIIAGFFLCSLLFACKQQGPTTQRSNAKQITEDSPVGLTETTGNDAPSGTYSVENGCDEAAAVAKTCKSSTSTATNTAEASEIQGVQQKCDPSTTKCTSGLVNSQTSTATGTGANPNSLALGEGLHLAGESSSGAKSTLTCKAAMDKMSQLCTPDPNTPIALSNIGVDVSSYFALPGSVISNANKFCTSSIEKSSVCKTYTKFSPFDGTRFTTTTTIAGCKGTLCTANGPSDMCSGCKPDNSLAPMTIQTVFTLIEAGKVKEEVLEEEEGAPVEE